MKIIDTNILYYKHKDADYKIEIEDNFITSVNALEFLRNIEKEHSSKAKYYIPLLKKAVHLEMTAIAKFHKNRPFNKRMSDAISFSFKGDFDDYMFYNNLSVADVINNRKQQLFNSSIEFFPKEDYKEIKDKFNFLVGNNLTCLQIENKDIELAYALLDLFLKNHSIKEDFRNSWNDLLILSKSVNSNAKLITKDKLLNKFATELYKAKTIYIGIDEIEIDFSEKKDDARDNTKFESKGYINRGWQYKIISRK